VNPSALEDIHIVIRAVRREQSARWVLAASLQLFGLQAPV
jgi:hypothetical protein